MKNLNAIRLLTLGVAVIMLLMMPLSAMLMWTAQDEALGKEVYAKRCQMCHGPDGKADTKAGQMTKTPDMTTGEWNHGTSQEDVEKLVREGAGKMKGFDGKLSDEEIAAVAYYTRKMCGLTEE
ncbi:MAG TPA: cytochrome c [Acidobacteriota bacterium]|nr:cytochrome c [Acidobacteriota bacterium]